MWSLRGTFMEVLKKYHAVVQEIKGLEQLKKELRSQILSQMDDRGVSSVESGEFVAKQSERVRVEYDKEQIEHILLSEGFKADQFTKQEVDLEKVGSLVANGLLDESLLLSASSLKKYSTLTVKGLDNG